MIITMGLLGLQLNESKIEDYLKYPINVPIKYLNLEKIDEGFHNADFLLSFEADGTETRLTMRLVHGDIGWGHDYMSDRAEVLLLQLFNSVPAGTCCQFVDVICITKSDDRVSARESLEFFNLVNEVTERYDRSCLDIFEITERKSIFSKKPKCDVFID